MRKHKNQLEIFDKDLNIKKEVEYEAIHTKDHYDRYNNLICRDFVHEFKPKGVKND